MDQASAAWWDIFGAIGATWRWPGRGPHAAYRLSAHHADGYLNTDVVVANQATLDRVVHQGLVPLVDRPRVEGVLVPRIEITAGVVLARALAGALKLPVLTLDVTTGACDGAVTPGVRLIVVTDDVHGGGTARRAIEAARQRGGTVGAVVALANFSGESQIAGVPISALLTTTFGVWPFGACPLCRVGSVALDARAAWSELAAT